LSEIILDASSIINLSKGDVVAKVVRLQAIHLFVGPLVIQECLGRIAELNVALEAKQVQQLDDSLLPAKAFFELREKHRLGNGETECLAFAVRLTNLLICTDDKAARIVAASTVGENRVVGSLFLLRECVRESILEKSEAALVHETMRLRGAFIPPLPTKYFD